jgi:hypothetical protein
MLTAAMRSGLVVAALVLPGATTGCLGDDRDADAPAESERSAPGGFVALERRSLELPSVEVPAGATAAERTFRRGADNCWAWGAPEPGAIVLPVIGQAPLGPYPGEAKLEQGPVYAAFLRAAPRIVFLSEERMVGVSGAWAVATFWVSRPTYDGPVLVRGGRLDRPGRIGFGGGAQPGLALRLPRGRWGPQPADIPQGWRTARIPIRIRDPGCYAVQVDGRGFSYVLPFAVLQSL